MLNDFSLPRWYFLNVDLSSPSDDPRNFTAISPASLLTSYLDPLVAVGQSHDRDMLGIIALIYLSPSSSGKVDSFLFTVPWLQW